jgi:hypothetical protein
VALEFHERRLINCNRAELVCANEMYVLLHPTSPVTWRAWDGSGFNLHMMSPHVTGQSVPVCAFLATKLSQGQVIYSSYLERYVYLAATGTNYEGRSACEFFDELSADLIYWSQHRRLTEARLPWCNPDSSQPAIEPVTVLYPALVDHADTTVNFETMGRTQHLYYARFKDGGLDRDLVRVPLTFTRTNRATPSLARKRSLVTVSEGHYQPHGVALPKLLQCSALGPAH